MAWIIITILVILWALGFGLARETAGHLVHVLLAVALVVLVLELVRRGRE